MAIKRSFSILALILVFILFSGVVLSTPVFALNNEDNREYDYIVGFEKGVVKNLGKDVASFGGKVEKNYHRINASKVSMTKRAAEAFKNQPGISFVEPDYPVYAASQTVTWGVEKVYELEEYPFDSWSITSGQGIKVAVLDTGIDEGHEDIPLLAGGYNAVGDESYWGNDMNGHGTHVAGIISAQNNELGVLGVSPAVNLYAVKVLDGNGSGSISTIIDGIQWAMNNDINIVNMSLGTYEYSEALEQICNEAYESGILLVAAAGNSGTTLGTGDNINYPALFDSVVAVTASDQMDSRAYFSSTGVKAEVMAPGVEVLSTIPDDALNSDLNISGSSISYISKIIEGSGIGKVEGPLVDLGLAVDIVEIESILLEKNITPEDDWIALIDRGTLTFSEKVSNVMNYGADGVVIMNDSESIFEEETLTLYASEEDYNTDWIPSIFVSYNTGQNIRVNNQYGKISVDYSNYGIKSGTSMASPYTAGTAAVLWAADPTLSNTDIRYVITSTALDLELPQEHQGYGLLQLNSGLELIMNNLEPIVKESLLLSDFSADSKIYDGNNSAAGSFNDNRNEGDNLEFNYDVEFVDKNVGLSKIVNFSNIEISGGLDKYKYILANTTGQAVANISPTALTGLPESPDTVYGDPVPEYYIDLSGFVEGEGLEELDQFDYVIESDYELGSPSGAYNLTVSAITISALNYEFNITQTNTFAVAQKPLNIEGSFRVSDKIYDGTKSAEILENDLFIQGVLDGDNVEITDVTAEFVSSEVGNDIEVKIIDLKIGGEDVDNYILDVETLPISYGDINPLPSPPSPPPSSGGSRGGGGSFTAADEELVYASINDIEKMDVGTMSEDEIDEKSYTKIILDTEKIEDIIKDYEDISESTMKIFSDTENSKLEIVISKDTVDILAKKNIELEILSPIGGFILPMNVLDLEDLIDELGDNIREDRLRLNLTISVPEEESLELIHEKIDEMGMNIVAEPVEYLIELNYGSIGLDVDRFNGYATKLVPLNKNLDINMNFAGVVFSEDETFNHLPSKLVEKDGRFYVFIKSMNNSIYTAVRKEVFALNLINHWSNDAVDELVSKLVITNPESFDPEENITRGEFADYITRALGLYSINTEDNLIFTDVYSDDPLFDSIILSVKHGIIKGYTDGTFKPNNTITRQEAMTMYARAMELIDLKYEDSQKILNYTDRNKVAKWAYEEVAKVLNAGVFNGTSPTTISPESTFRYSEAATAVKNLLSVFMEVE